jgi:hypothetical protein
MRTRFRIATLVVAVLVAACSDDSSTEPHSGSENGKCYGNGTCNQGLVCASNVCVRLPDLGISDLPPVDLKVDVPSDLARDFRADMSEQNLDALAQDVIQADLWQLDVYSSDVIARDLLQPDSPSPDAAVDISRDLPPSLDAVVDLPEDRSSPDLGVPTWKLVHTASGSSTPYWAIWGSGPNDIFAVGRTSSGATGRITHFDGNVWSDMALPTGTSQLWGVWGTGPKNVYAGGEANDISRRLLRYDGLTWRAQPLGSPPPPSSFGPPYGIWGSGPSDIYAVTYNGNVTRFNGIGWLQQTTPDLMPSHPSNGYTLNSIWGSGPNDIFAVGGITQSSPWSGMLLHYDGLTWKQQADSSGNSEELWSVWGTGSTNVYAVGRSGVILNYKGATWTQMFTGTKEHLRGVWGTSATNVYAVGVKGTVLHYNGSGITWTPVVTSIPADVDLSKIWGTSPDNIYVVGGKMSLSNPGVIYRYSP